MTIDDVLARFPAYKSGGPDRWLATCPVPGHQDSRASVAVSQGERGILMYCHGGCDTEEVMEHLGLEWPDLFEDSGRVRKSKRRELTDTEAQHRHLIYSELLHYLTLTSEHQQELGSRGLWMSQIERSGYRTLNTRGVALACEALRKVYQPEQIARVPGFQRRGSKVELTIRHGLLIPVRDTTGRIIAAQVRTGDPDRKYQWLSSPKAPVGSPVHIPLLSPGANLEWVDELRVTEGPLKADIASARDGQLSLTVGVAGVTAWRALIPVLRSFKRLRTVRVAYDADWHRKKPVAMQMQALVRALDNESYRVVVEEWDEADGKGIDDLLVGGGYPTQVEANAA